MWFLIFLVDNIVLNNVIEMYLLIFNMFVDILLGVIFNSLIFLRCCFNIFKWVLIKLIMFVYLNFVSVLFKVFVILVMVLVSFLKRGWKFLFVVVCLYKSDSVFVIFLGVESIIVVLLVWWVVVLMFVMCK